MPSSSGCFTAAFLRPCCGTSVEHMSRARPPLEGAARAPVARSHRQSVVQICFEKRSAGQGRSLAALRVRQI